MKRLGGECGFYSRFSIKRCVPITVDDKGVKIRDPLFLDIFVDDKIIVEVKATER